ncbi:hypothetical protein GOARA_057_00310 [Gordonia araii NBRC 100433]|uniref:Uncharacterized protein n=1 Tax=Gordonia araii NBRC 100433 TaxID=1073574 RepID=G7H3T2_9ACTN|nr:hypothetical protein [Gordonia araii]NNG98671.1 hypothetical protein [Gordonia araii NBRC 100433]GAB10507.1 hypothetical protein GOARA_057_00310 [Gordonia araii NBRC 100433]
MTAQPTRLIAATAIALAGIAAPAPLAHAGEVRHKTTAICKSISPNVIDNPYAGRITTTQWLPKERGRITVVVAQSKSVFGYQNRPRLAWHNLTTGERGHASTISYSNLNAGAATFINIRTGSGRVTLKLRTYNSNKFWSLRSTACSATVRVR